MGHRRPWPKRARRRITRSTPFVAAIANELAVKRTVYAGGFQYIYNTDVDTEELYDLSRDPEEKENIAGQHPEKCRRFKSLLEGWEKQAQLDGEKYRAGRVELDEETREKLKNLGYIE